MHWNQIEHQWNAMTRRIRSDWKDGPRSMPGQGTAGPKGSEIPTDRDMSDTSSSHARLPTNL